MSSSLPSETINERLDRLRDKISSGRYKIRAIAKEAGIDESRIRKFAAGHTLRDHNVAKVEAWMIEHGGFK